MKKISFIIVSPLPFAGGPICLHYLCKLLNDKGYSSKVFVINGGINTKEGYT